ncbi:MAG TPA: shikimate kinase [Acidimicrobiales bacterium]|nr:shikimate kinase [Acidimicrobiales bacterium]
MAGGSSEAPRGRVPDTHIVLVGMMGSGKTTVGSLLAGRLDRELIDSDAQVEARSGRTVREIFETDGEPAFRVLETEALAAALASETPAVIAAAGGAVLDPANRQRIADAGEVVWLDADLATLTRRATDGDHRPLLADDPEATLARMAEERRPLYHDVADHEVDVADCGPEQAVERILEAISR